MQFQSEGVSVSQLPAVSQSYLTPLSTDVTRCRHSSSLTALCMSCLCFTFQQETMALHVPGFVNVDFNMHEA